MNTKPTGYPVIDEILESIAPKTPTPPVSGAGEWRVEPLAIHGWRVVETATGREVISCVYRQEDAERIVADHAAVPRLVEALEAAMKAVSDRAAGGCMLTTAEEASEIWGRCHKAILDSRST